MKKSGKLFLLLALALCLTACGGPAASSSAEEPPAIGWSSEPQKEEPDTSPSLPEQSEPASQPEQSEPALQPEQSEPASQPEQEPAAEPEAPPEKAENHKLYILMYHHFVPEGTECNNWMLTGARFREDLEWLAGHGYQTVLPSQLAAGEPLPERAVMLTLDDGYASNYHIAYPLLQEFQAKAVISLITQYIEDGNAVFLTWDMCGEMVQSGLVELGSHTNALHDGEPGGVKRLKEESREAYQARVFPDLQTSIDLIQDNTGVQVQFFAYPRGITDAWAKDFIRENFAISVTTRYGAADLSKGLYSLPRCNVAPSVPLSKILPS